MALHFCSQSKLKVVGSILENTVSALSSAVQQSHLRSQPTDNQDSNEKQIPSEYTSPGSIFELCGEAAKHTSGYGSADFWQRLSCEVSAAVQEMSAVQEESDVLLKDRDQQHELELLCCLSKACVHVGVILSQLLIPTSVDPVFMTEMQYNCCQLLVSGIYVYA